MKQEYGKPILEVVGDVRELTAAAGLPRVVDVPLGTPVQPGMQVIGSSV